MIVRKPFSTTRLKKNSPIFSSRTWIILLFPFKFIRSVFGCVVWAKDLILFFPKWLSWGHFNICLRSLQRRSFPTPENRCKNLRVWGRACMGGVERGAGEEIPFIHCFKTSQRLHFFPTSPHNPPFWLFVAGQLSPPALPQGLDSRVGIPWAASCAHTLHLQGGDWARAVIRTAGGVARTLLGDAYLLGTTSSTQLTFQHPPPAGR